MRDVNVAEKRRDQRCPSRTRTNAKNPVSLLRVEQIVFVLVAAHPTFHRWIPLVAVSDAHVILEPITTDGRTLCIALVVLAMATLAGARAVTATAHPFSGRTPGEVKGWVDVVAAMPTAGAGKSTDATAGI